METIANRLLSATNEPLRIFGPLSGLFACFDRDSPPSFDDSLEEFLTSIRAGHVPLSDQHGDGRVGNVIEQISRGAELAKNAARDMKMFTHKETLLSLCQLAAIHLYTQETDADRCKDSLYALVNAVLRSENRAMAKHVRKLIWLLMTALRLCPKSDRKTLYRGVKANIA